MAAFFLLDKHFASKFSRMTVILKYKAKLQFLKVISNINTLTLKQVTFTRK